MVLTEGMKVTTMPALTMPVSIRPTGTVPIPPTRSSVGGSVGSSVGSSIGSSIGSACTRTPDARAKVTEEKNGRRILVMEM